MRKTWTIATREYLAAVRTKLFILSVVALPLLMAGGLLVGNLTRRVGDSAAKRVAVIDRTPGQALFAALKRAADERNAQDKADAGGPPRAPFDLEKIDPAPLSDPAAVDRQRYDLAQQVRTDALFAIVEIGPDVVKPDPAAMGGALAGIADLPDALTVRYSTNRPTYLEFRQWLQAALTKTVILRRALSEGVPLEKVASLVIPPIVVDRGLADKSAGGKIGYESAAGQLANVAVPVALLGLMFTVVAFGVSPMATNVIEEKQLRIAEVLLGSVSPFQLMMGKLLGGVGVALTLAAIYVAGAYASAAYYGFAGYVRPGLLAWFAAFTVGATMLYGALFAAAGAAVTNVKEAQTLIAPVMILQVSPLLIVRQVLEDPNGWLPTAASFFPPATPMLAVLRMGISPGIPAWQAVALLALTAVSTVAVVWVSGRIFRVGILTQGKAAKPGELVRWIFSSR